MAVQFRYAFVLDNDGLKVVNVVNENPLNIVDLRLHVARHRNVDEKHGALLALVNIRERMSSPKNRLVGPCAAHDNIRCCCDFMQRRVRDGLRDLRLIDA